MTEVWTAIGPEPLDPETLAGRVASPGSGATVTFTGAVRDDGVVALEYEAHPAACEFLAAVARDVATRHPGLTGVAVAHRTGRLPVGGIAFVAAVAAPHRGEAFAACADLVDAVKAGVPVWKQEWYADGTGRWVGAP